MRFDLLWILDQNPELGETSSDVLARVLDETVAAEALGFSGCWYAEHHFTPYGVCPSPPVLLAAAASRTRRIRLGAAVSVLPLAHPVRTAEDYAMVDIISGGRLDLGVGSGYLSHEYEGFALPFAEKRARFDEALEFMLDLWNARVREHPGPAFPAPAVAINVPPVQRPHPPVWIAVVRAESVRPVARKGFPIMLIPYAVTTLDRHLDLFSTAYRRAAPGGRFPGLAAAYHAVVAPTTHQARDALMPALRRYIASRTQHIGGTPDEIVRNELVIAGDPAACVERIRRLAVCGVDHLLLITSFGGLPSELVAQTTRLLAEEVMPAFGASAPAAPSRDTNRTEPAPLPRP